MSPPEQRWIRSRAGPEWWARVAAAYSEPHRRYHTLAHLAHIFDEAARFEPLAPAVEWAIWFHDYVYDPRSATNEEDSAREARTALAELGKEPTIVERTAQLILATKHGSAHSLEKDTRPIRRR